MKLLVSVRSVEEAAAALAGRADLIDIKEPSRGSLGRADITTITGIIQAVGNRALISAAMGELEDSEIWKRTSGPFQKLEGQNGGSLPHYAGCLTYIKFGLSRCVRHPWQAALNAIATTTQSTVVPVAYADFDRAECPPVHEIVDFVIANRFGTMLIDTFRKDGSCLFDWLKEARLKRWVEHLAEQAISVALAGSLRTEHLSAIKRINPAWVAVRGAVCGNHDRTGVVQESLVHGFRQSLHQSDAVT